MAGMNAGAVRAAASAADVPYLSIGEPVTVRVEKVELWRRRIDFTLVEGG